MPDESKGESPKDKSEVVIPKGYSLGNSSNDLLSDFISADNRIASIALGIGRILSVLAMLGSVIASLYYGSRLLGSLTIESVFSAVIAAIGALIGFIWWYAQYVVFTRVQQTINTSDEKSKSWD